MASIIRDAVTGYIEEKQNANWKEDPFFKAIGIMKNGASDLSIRHDKYLYNQTIEKEND